MKTSSRMSSTSSSGTSEKSLTSPQDVLAAIASRTNADSTRKSAIPP